MPEAQSALRSGGQDSRKACSSRVMDRTFALFTRARLSSRARLVGARQGFRWAAQLTLLWASLGPSLPQAAQSPQPPLCPAALRWHVPCTGGSFGLCLPAEGGITFSQAFHHGGPMPLHGPVVRLHKSQQGCQGYVPGPRRGRGPITPWTYHVNPWLQGLLGPQVHWSGAGWGVEDSTHNLARHVGASPDVPVTVEQETAKNVDGQDLKRGGAVVRSRNWHRVMGWG